MDIGDLGYEEMSRRHELDRPVAWFRGILLEVSVWLPRLGGSWCGRHILFFFFFFLLISSNLGPAT
jgi:hypothetical protein